MTEQDQKRYDAYQVLTAARREFEDALVKYKAVEAQSALPGDEIRNQVIDALDRALVNFDNAFLN